MSKTVIAIVEGHGEVTAVPVLLRRVASELGGCHIEVPRPIRIPRDKLVNSIEIARAVELAARQVGNSGGIIILLDSDKECPVTVAKKVLAAAREARSDIEIRVVVAQVEFEAWFLAAINSLRGKRGLLDSVEPPANPEAVTDAKGWITRHSRSGSPYRETIDQAAFSAVFDLAEARSARSFDKFCRDVLSLLE